MATKLENKTLDQLPELFDPTGSVIYALKDSVDYKLSLSGAFGVSSIDTGTGLTGGPITTFGTISLSSGAQASLAKADSAVQPGALAPVAFNGDYGSLINRPTIPTAPVNPDWNASSGLAQILNKPSLAAVATSGSYNDLINKPALNFEPSFSKGSIIAGNNVTITGTLTNRLVGSGDITINAVQPPAEGGGVSAVTATAPVASTGGTTPNISMAAATASNDGYMTAAQVTKLNGIATGATANTGTVTSVGLTMPDGFNVTTGAITTSGNTIVEYVSKPARRFLASPTNASGVPTWRTIVMDDLPTITANEADTAVKLKTARNIQTNLASGSAVAFDGTVNVTPGVTGTLDISNGGTGSTTASAARSALGLTIGSNVQAYSANLTSWAALTPSAKQNTITGAGLTKVTCSSSSPGSLQAGELYLKY